jgi:hypothetical protein
MTAAQLLRLLGYLWAAFGIYWVAAGLKGKAAQTQEAPYYRLTRLGILALTFALLFSQRTAVGILRPPARDRLPHNFIRRFHPRASGARCCGVGTRTPGSILE